MVKIQKYFSSFHMRRIWPVFTLGTIMVCIYIVVCIMPKIYDLNQKGVGIWKSVQVMDGIRNDRWRWKSRTMGTKGGGKGWTLWT